MLFPNQIYNKLGFNEIKEEIKKECISSMGRTMVDKMQFISNYDLLSKLLNQTHEFKEILLKGRKFPADNFFDIKTLTEKVRVEGTYLLEEEFLKLLQALITVKACIHFIREEEGQYPSIELLIKDIEFDLNIIKSIEAIIDVKGNIKPNASSELKEITQSILSAESDVRKRITQIFKEWQKEGYTSDSQLTVRDGRMVIPIAAEYKRKAKGFIVDESSTGQTVFMEPTEVLDLNNKIKDLEYQRKREIIKILTELTNKIRPYLPQLHQYHQLLTILDFIRAKALFAIRIDANLPELSREPNFRWLNARHPLLLISFKSIGKKVIPLKAELNEEQRIIVISGPNAGGKSVALKTIGLIQLMLQHGLLVPLSADSKLAVMKKILVDIGDDQSIESDLSTYSAHLSNMNTFIREANPHTMILIDEFGTGTDPKFGGPMAEAVLETLNKKNVKGVITTHYSNLKVFASSTNGLVNASMLFDTVELKALYQLEIGQPGSSYAFEIAQKTGLSKQLIDLAKQKVGRQQQKVDDLLIEIQRDKLKLDSIQKELEADKVQLQSLLETNKSLKAELDENKRRLLRDSKEEAKKILSQANKLIENTIAEIRNANAEKQTTKKIRLELDQKSEELLKSIEPTKSPKIEKTKSQIELKIGDWVKLIDTETTARILNIQKSKVELAIGDIRSFVNVNKIEKIQAPKQEKISRTSSNILNNSESFLPSIDIRGKRAEEALVEVEKFIDKALMMGFSQLRILHGKGDGILRKIIRESLRKYKEVKSIEDEHVDFGGDGISIVHL